MTGEYPVVLFQGDQLLEGLFQGVIAAAGEIGSADAACKQGITGEYGILTNKAYTTGGMTGGVDDPEGQSCGFHCIAIVIAVGVIQLAGGKSFGQCGFLVTDVDSAMPLAPPTWSK